MKRTSLVLVGLLILGNPLHAVEPALSPYLPEDTKVIARANLDNLVASKQLKEKDLQTLLDRWYRNTFATQLSSDSTESALGKVKTMTVAFPAAGDPHAFVVIHGAIDPKILQQHAKGCKSIKEDGKEGDTVIYKQKLEGSADPLLTNIVTVKPPETLWFAALDENDWVLSARGKEDVVRAIRIKAGKDKPGLNEAMTKLSEATQTKQDGLTMLMVGHKLPKEVADQLPKESQRPFEQCQTLTGHIRYGEKVTGVMEYVAKTPQGAAEAEKAVKENKEAVRRNFLVPLQPAVASYNLIVLTQGKDKVPEPLRASMAQYTLVSLMVTNTQVKRTGNKVTVVTSVPASRAAEVLEPFLPKPQEKPKKK